MDEEDPLEKEMTPHSSNLAWEIPWREEVGRQQAVESSKVIHDLATMQQIPARAVDEPGPWGLKNNLIPYTNAKVWNLEKWYR